MSLSNRIVRATLVVTVSLLSSVVAAAAQSSEPSQQRPTLNRHGEPSPTATPQASPLPGQSPGPAPTATPSVSPSPEPGSGQPGAPVEYPRPSYPDLLPHFDYDSHAGLEMRETDVQKRGDVRLIELSYAGAGGDRVPAYLLIPHGNGPFPAIIWGHWLMQGSPLANKDEFLEEALVLARSGVVSLLIDAPQARHDFVELKGASTLDQVKQQSDAAGHQVIDLRRGVDLIYGRPYVDRKRIAYVGHSWDAHVGAILAGVETRINAFVLMASGYSDEEELFASKDPARRERIKEAGEDNVREYFH
ncbi:MAG TPA: hypothetical protein VFF39_09445, partial [Verrucomicrobiae bacterium]|nr:hypothetical protein [Verrucomicrobiae bacterium]